MGHDAKLGRLLRNTADAVALFASDLAGLATEELRVAHLDADGRVIGMSWRGDAHVAAVDLPVRDIVRDAIAYGSRALVLAHNHPSGDATPSRADKTATRRLADLARILDIRILDHLVFAGGEMRSFRAMGLL